MSTQSKVGTIGWTDLTVGNAEEIRKFYSDVVGWTSDPVDMGGYNDFNMNAPATNETIAGICHARGSNADLPAQWILYITVENLDHSAARCQELGGKIRHELGWKPRYEELDQITATAWEWHRNHPDGY